SDFPMEITPEVNNYIRHKLIKFAKGREKADSKAGEPTDSADTTNRIISAKQKVENIRSMLGRRTA
ncbi:ATP-dependent helicase, partial [Salmonella enterica subsp. enterica serovar Newport]